ncbi:hypothetical protein SHAb15599_00125 [Acinetobacter phage SH-Ab 15599]|nr:hypothetical protein SHAb15599_00125 [Acinetobacter phage SH-Ab 15599]
MLELSNEDIKLVEQAGFEVRIAAELNYYEGGIETLPRLNSARVEVFIRSAQSNGVTGTIHPVDIVIPTDKIVALIRLARGQPV